MVCLAGIFLVCANLFLALGIFGDNTLDHGCIFICRVWGGILYVVGVIIAALGVFDFRTPALEKENLPLKPPINKKLVAVVLVITLFVDFLFALYGEHKGWVPFYKMFGLTFLAEVICVSGSPMVIFTFKYFFGKKNHKTSAQT